MSTTKAEELKAKGNESFKSKRYIQALEYYKDALKEDKSNVAIYNNLAAAAHQLGNYQDAKRHASDGLGVSVTSKGFVRLGAAHWALEEWVDAIKAYEDALKETPNDETVKKALEDVKVASKKPKTTYSAPPPQQQQYQQQQAPPPGQFYASPPPPPATGGEPIPMMVDLTVCCTAVLHLVTMLFAYGLSMLLWKACLAAMMARQFLILKPTFKPSLEFVKSLPNTFAGLYFALCGVTVMMNAPPLHLLMASMCIYTAADIVFAHQGLLMTKIPPQLEGRILPYIDKIRMNKDQLFANAAMCEVVMGVMMPLSGAGGIVMLVYWYFLKYRYLSDRYSKMAFQITAQQAGKLFYHPRCPSMIGNLFTKLQDAMYKMATGGN